MSGPNIELSLALTIENEGVLLVSEQPDTRESGGQDLSIEPSERLSILSDPGLDCDHIADRFEKRNRKVGFKCKIFYLAGDHLACIFPMPFLAMAVSLIACRNRWKGTSFNISCTSESIGCKGKLEPCTEMRQARPLRVQISAAGPLQSTPCIPRAPDIEMGHRSLQPQVYQRCSEQNGTESKVRKARVGHGRQLV